MKLYHYSNEPLTTVDDVAQAPVVRPIASTHWKPRGLWVTPEGEDNWFHWCQGENFQLDRLTHRTEVVLQPDAKIRYVDSVADLDDFDAAYGMRLLDFGSDRRDAIDWPKLAETYDGIVIAPYFYERRLSNLFWYYTWDCASGCIWRKRAVKELRPAELERIPEPLTS